MGGGSRGEYAERCRARGDTLGQDYADGEFHDWAQKHDKQRTYRVLPAGGAGTSLGS